MKLPKTVKIGPTTYKVKVVKDLRNTKDEQLFGSYNPAIGEIKIDSETPENRWRKVLLHEVLHGIWCAQSMYKGEYAKHEEEIVSLLTPMLLSFLQDNKELVKELSK